MNRPEAEPHHRHDEGAEDACLTSVPSPPTYRLSDSGRPLMAAPLTRLVRKSLAVTLAGLMAVPVSMPLPVAAQSRGPMIIRDQEIENLLRDYANPILGVAGVRKSGFQIVLVQDRGFNAFVADGRRMFINTGALMDAKTPNEIIGVIAHETGHIAGGHLQRLREQMATAQILAMAGMLLGAGAAIGTARSPQVGNSGVGAMGIGLGAQDMAMRSLLSYQRGEEQAADRSALKYLEATQQSPKGLLETFQRFNQEAMFKTTGVDPYLVSHPFPQERISNLETTAKKSPYWDKKDPHALQARHDLMRAKLFGFTARADEVGRRYPLSDNSAPARYARAIAAYRNKQLGPALAGIDSLTREQPNNPYFWELKGQVLLEFGRANEAVTALRRSVSLAPNSGMIKGMLGQALVATGTPANVDAAIGELSNAAMREPESSDIWRHLATAYSRKGQEGQAHLAAAQAYFFEGDYSAAATQANRAKQLLPPNSPGWLKAEDILNYRPPRSAQRNN